MELLRLLEFCYFYEVTFVYNSCFVLISDRLIHADMGTCLHYLRLDFVISGYYCPVSVFS